ncbi:MAG TPA: hypothetical protein VKN82_08205 [Desulfohalobiaceae bacterium]|nr:hypothetical protein [Desulfohalobiaceae bacterium]
MNKPISIDSANIDHRSGELVIQSRYRQFEMYTINPWEQGLKCYLLTGQCEIESEPPPEFPLLGLDQNTDIAKSLRQFTVSIPSDIKEKVCPFSYRQLAILQLVRKNRYCQNLLDTNPLLLWLIAHRLDGSDLTVNQAASLANERQTEILKQLLGFGSKSLSNFLKKLVPCNLDWPEFKILMAVLKRPDIWQSFTHNKSVTLPLLEIVLEEPEIAKLPVLRKELENPKQSIFYIRHLKMLYKSCRKLAQNHSITDFESAIKRCRHFIDLNQYFQTLHQRFNHRLTRQIADWEQAQETQEYLERLFQARTEELQATERQEAHTPKRKPKDINQKFPDPPIPGNKDIRPITSSYGLIYEGRKSVMDNCVGGMEYRKKVLNKEIYIYRVYRPERCTLELIITPSGQLEIGQLLLKGNKHPKKETRRFVEDWLREYNKSFSL